MQTTNDPVVLWELAPEDHSAWLTAGCGTGTCPEYFVALAAAKEAAQAAGRKIVMLRATVAQVMAEVRVIGMSPNAVGCELALRSLAGKNRRRN